MSKQATSFAVKTGSPFSPRKAISKETPMSSRSLKKNPLFMIVASSLVFGLVSAMAATTAQADLIYSQDFGAYDPVNGEYPSPVACPGCTPVMYAGLPTSEAAADNWWSGSTIGGSYWVEDTFQGHAGAGVTNFKKLWGTSGLTTGAGDGDNMFVTDPIAVVSGETYTFSFDSAYETGPYVLSPEISYDGTNWTDLGPNLTPYLINSGPSGTPWPTYSYDFDATASTVYLRISNLNTTNNGNDGGIAFVELNGPGPVVPPSPSSVPEPTTLALAAIGLLSLGVTRRRRRR